MICHNANENVDNHFADVRKMVSLGSGSERDVDNLMLTRYACYLELLNITDIRHKISLFICYSKIYDFDY